tara:strand:+ start:22 stop:615 length:594 start_codon:yes stop_codon:yes gene_type:complete
MGFEIKDGTGTGNLARVDAENRVAVRAITETEIEKAVLDGRAFNINTEFLSITTDVEHAILYVKNNEDQDLIIAAWFNGTDLGTNGANAGIIKVYYNPTGGTIISDATAVTPVNRNAGSSRVLLADAFSGGNAKTFTGQDTPAVLYQTQTVGSRAFGGVFLTLPKGSSLVSTYDPNGAETINIYTGFQVYVASDFRG